MGLEDQVYIATYCNLLLIKGRSSTAKSSSHAFQNNDETPGSMIPHNNHTNITILTQTDVFESVVNGIPLMRRCSDDWINATQILRIANFPKNKRTKILEKQVQIHTHEKVQGGYGRFQGTWIPLHLLRNLASEYGIGASIAPLLYSETKELVATPFKRKGKPGRNLGIDNDINPSPTKVPKSSEKKKISKLKKDKAVKNLKFQSQEEQLSNDLYRQFQLQQQNSMPMGHQQQSAPQGPPLGPPQFMPMFQQIPFQQYNFPNQQFFPGTNSNVYGMPQFQQQMQQQMQQMQQQHQLPQQHQQHQQHQHPQQPLLLLVMQQHHQPSNSQDSVSSTNIFSATEDRRNSELSIFSNHSVTLISPPVITSANNSTHQYMHQEPPLIEEDEQSMYTAQLLDYFERDNAQIPKFLYRVPLNFKVNDPIDDEGHTPLHWALSLLNLEIIEVLMNLNNANPTVPNNTGINCLSKMVQFNNSYELKNFPQILEMFKICLVTPDFNARIPLHYIMELLDKNDDRNIKSLKYYLFETIKFAEQLPTQGGKSLLKILLNHQDINGDTTLHLCARARRHKYLLKFLLTKGADLNVCNNSGVACKDLISIDVLEELQRESMSMGGLVLEQEQQLQPLPQQTSTPQQPERKNKKDIIEDKENIFVENSLNQICDEFKVEVGDIDADDEEDHSIEDESHDQSSHGVTHVVRHDSPKMAPMVATKTNSMNTFQEKIPELLSSLNDSFHEQINDKDEEYKHNLSIYQTLNENYRELNKVLKSKNEKLGGSVVDQVNELEKELFAKQKKYLCYLEKSQSLQLLKLVQEQEKQEERKGGEQEQDEHENDHVYNVLKLSLKQFKRKKLITDLILQMCNHEMKKPNFSNYKKLISKACGLDDVNDELLDDIEELLLVK